MHEKLSAGYERSSCGSSVVAARSTRERSAPMSRLVPNGATRRLRVACGGAEHTICQRRTVAQFTQALVGARGVAAGLGSSSHQGHVVGGVLSRRLPCPERRRGRGPLEPIPVRPPRVIGWWTWFVGFGHAPEMKEIPRCHVHTHPSSHRSRGASENIRPIPATDSDFAGLYKRRNDAESINRALDDTLWLRRAHSIGHARQHLNLLTFALGVNSLALHRHRGRSSDPPTTQAAA